MVTCLSTYNKGSNKLTGGLPSELGMIESLTHADFGEMIKVKGS